MDLRIALAGNPNCGKTTLFNALTGMNQYVGNWPGVTVEKKEGKMKKHDGVIITDLPGIYSLSPYTLEEVVARNYLVGERPDAILNIVDGTNLERNLYLTTQLMELGIPVVIAINMMDVVRKNGDKIDIDQLAKLLRCSIVEISALKGDGIIEAAEVAIEAAKQGHPVPRHNFSGTVEHALAHIEEATVHDLPEEQQRWYAVKIFERDDKVLSELDLPKEKLAHLEKDITEVEQELDDDAESIITNERYNYIASMIGKCYTKPRSWIVLEAKYSTFAKWQDQLTFTWHVLLETRTATENKGNKEGLPPYSYFTTTVTYQNIPMGSHAASVCLHPSYLERYGEPCAIGIVVTNAKGEVLAGDCEAQGTEVKNFAHPKSIESAFWNDQNIMNATRGGEPIIERRQGLLDRSKTIWALVNPNDYELVIQ